MKRICEAARTATVLQVQMTAEGTGGIALAVVARLQVSEAPLIRWWCPFLGWMKMNWYTFGSGIYVCNGKHMLLQVILYLFIHFMCNWYLNNPLKLQQYCRTEVFDKYYFPANWETCEMEALIGYLKLEDPSARKRNSTGGDSRHGSLRGSGKCRGSATEVSRSWQGGRDARLKGSFTSSLTSLTKKILVSINYVHAVCFFYREGNAWLTCSLFPI